MVAGYHYYYHDEDLFYLVGEEEVNGCWKE